MTQDPSTPDPSSASQRPASHTVFASRSPGGVIAATPVPAGGLPVPEWLTRLTDVMVNEDPIFGRMPPPTPDAKRSAVLVLFGPAPAAAARPGEHVVLIERSHDIRSHAAQIAFPGGGVEPADETLADTALREAHEEIGVDPAGIHVLANLPDLFLPPSEHLVTPVLAWWSHPSPVRVNDATEIADVLLTPVSDLVDPAYRHTVVHPSGYAGPAFDLDDLLLWGFTGGIVSGLLDFAGLSRQWDPAITRELPARYARRDRDDGVRS